jgi:hypothetical protein
VVFLRYEEEKISVEAVFSYMELARGGAVTSNCDNEKMLASHRRFPSCTLHKVARSYLRHCLKILTLGVDGGLSVLGRLGVEPHHILWGRLQPYQHGLTEHITHSTWMLFTLACSAYMIDATV